ncbi:hypothetical protein UFOVP516_8 [uncultured Caudovirales phage]|uniref:Uncharacterized protein n=1 Tax=uncultured Caudovirales phage TaxID=2100421 RepID=A0A6J5ML47_9CAUD|nr:hypothetical protein UFOVP516_8 [uncultured Caudovirales phage]
MYYNLISSMKKVVSGGIDSDATAFITAAGITDPTQQGAINTLVLSLKSYGVWTKIKAIYPMVGGTATTHKYNLKDPRDLDAAFRLTFNGGWTHSSNGATPNGTTGYANTYLNPVAQSLTSADAHLSYYARTAATTVDPAEIANFTDVTTGFALQSIGELTQNRFFFGYPFRAFKTVTVAATGFMLGSSSGNSRRDIYNNGTSVGNNTSVDTSTLGNYNLYIACANYSGTSMASFSNAQCAFASIGNQLTSTEVANYYTAVQNFNTTLSRQI